MALLGLLGISAFAFASFIVGLRLLWLAARTGELPERAIGASLLLAGGVGTTLLVIAGQMGAARGVLATAAMFAVDCGIAVLGIFTWQVFRPGPVGAALLALFGGLVFLSFSTDLASGFYLGVRRPEFSMAADYAGRLGMYGWATLEALRQYVLARRRLRLGLSDPLVANRFLLWGVGTLAALGVWLHALWRELSGAGSVEEAYLVIALLGGACAVSIWLAFFPPRAYRRWFESSGGAA